MSSNEIPATEALIGFAALVATQLISMWRSERAARHAAIKVATTTKDTAQAMTRDIIRVQQSTVRAANATADQLTFEAEEVKKIAREGFHAFREVNHQWRAHIEDRLDLLSFSIDHLTRAVDMIVARIDGKPLPEFQPTHQPPRFIEPLPEKNAK